MILDEIVVKTKQRMKEVQREISLQEIKEKALAMNKDTGYPFEKALRGEEIQFICEVKKASPSKGLIAPDFPYVQIAREYEQAGAAAISVLTEPYFFQGANAYLTEIRQRVSIPLLRKDFTVDPYMIYEAKVIGADAILLICAVLSDRELKEYYDIIRHEGGSFAGTTIEMVPKGYNKAVGIAAVIRIYGIPWEDTIVFGDSNNDISMFEYAHTKVAMGNGSVKIREMADYITSDMFHDGIREGLCHLGLIQ